MLIKSHKLKKVLNNVKGNKIKRFLSNKIAVKV